ncbi:MAG: hypothetical protein ACRDD7_05460, partial [Peptostreptococcaceae bacterium]
MIGIKEKIKLLENYIGDTVTYKQLTELLQIKYYKGGDSKTRQLNEIQSYYRLEKIKTKYLIVEKYDTPIPITDNRQSIYYNDLEIIILHALQNSKSYHNCWSVTEALLVTSLVNSNYRIGKKDIQLTADVMEIDIDYLNTFYQFTHSRFKSIFESALKRMSSKKLIDYKEITMIHKRVSIIKTNSLGNPIITDTGAIEYTTKKVYTEATQQERQYILKVEKKIMKEMGYKKIGDIVTAGKYYDYKNKVNTDITKNLNIEYYYKAYDIVHNDTDISEAIDEIKSYMCENNLNCIKLKALEKS